MQISDKIKITRILSPWTACRLLVVILNHVHRVQARPAVHTSPPASSTFTSMYARGILPLVPAPRTAEAAAERIQADPEPASEPGLVQNRAESGCRQHRCLEFRAEEAGLVYYSSACGQSLAEERLGNARARPPWCGFSRDRKGGYNLYFSITMGFFVCKSCTWSSESALSPAAHGFNF